MRTVRTTIDLNTGGLEDYEVEIEIAYTVYPGCRATSLTPAEEPTATIGAIVVIAGGKHYAADWLADMLSDDEELLGFCLLDWEEDRAAQAEYRAEAIRDDRMMEARQ